MKKPREGTVLRGGLGRLFVSLGVLSLATLVSGVTGIGVSSGASKVVTVGMVATRTGGGTIETGAYEAASAYFKNADAHGGISGYKVNFVGYDDGSNAATAIADYNRLIPEADALIVGDESDFIGAASAVAGKGVPLIGCIFAPQCYSTKGMYPVAPFVEKADTAVIIAYLQAHHVHQVAILSVNNAAGQYSLNIAVQAVTAAGIKIALNTSFDPTTSDFTALVARAKASGASDVIFVPGNTQQFMQAVVQQGYKAKVFLPGPIAGLPAQLGPKANGDMLAANYVGSLGAGAAGTDAYKITKKYYPSLSLANFQIWGTVAWTASQAIAAGITDLASKGQPVNGANLIKALDKFKNWQSTFGVPLTYTDGANSNPAHCLQLQENLHETWSLVGTSRFFCWTYSTAP